MIPRLFVVGNNSKYVPMVLAAFADKATAQTWCDSANRWYGEGHPLTPLKVWPNDVLYEPKPFPDPNGSIESIFEAL